MTAHPANSEMLDLLDRFLSAIGSGDIEGARACYAPDAKIWHNHDDVEQTVDQNLKVLAWMARVLPKRNYRIVRREVLSDGILQQHVLEATLPDGTAWRMPACVILRIHNGRITRLDEYLDSAAAAVLSTLGR